MESWDAFDTILLDKEYQEFIERHADELADELPSETDVVEAARRMEMFESNTRERGQRYMPITTARFDRMAGEKNTAVAEANLLRGVVNNLQSEIQPLRALCLILAVVLGLVVTR